jgi:hypothetical protein
MSLQRRRTERVATQYVGCGCRSQSGLTALTLSRTFSPERTYPYPSSTAQGGPIPKGDLPIGGLRLWVGGFSYYYYFAEVWPALLRVGSG